MSQGLAPLPRIRGARLALASVLRAQPTPTIAHLGNSGNGYTWPMDARELRTANALRIAVFELAAQHDIAQVTTTELALYAGVARRTVYNHGRSPQELLFRFLSEELTKIREELESTYPTRSVAESFEFGLRAVLAHVADHRAIYEQTGSGSVGAVWHQMLTSHFAGTLSGFLRWYHPTVYWQSGIAGASRPEIQAVAAEVFAHSMAGAIEAWLRMPGRREPELCFEIIKETVPVWLHTPHSGANG